VSYRGMLDSGEKGTITCGHGQGAGSVISVQADAHPD